MKPYSRQNTTAFRESNFLNFFFLGEQVYVVEVISVAGILTNREVQEIRGRGNSSSKAKTFMRILGNFFREILHSFGTLQKYSGTLNKICISMS